MNKYKLSFGLILLLSFAVSVSAEVRNYYEINLEYNDGEITAKRLTVTASSKELTNSPGTYVAEILSFDDKILNITFFDIPLTIFFDMVNPGTGDVIGGGMKELNETEVTIYVPYYRDAKEVNIYNASLDLQLSIPVDSYAKDYELLAQEREKKEKKEKDSPAAETQGSSEEKPNRVFLGLAVGIILIAVLIFVIIMIRGKRRR